MHPNSVFHTATEAENLAFARERASSRARSLVSELDALESGLR